MKLTTVYIPTKAEDELPDKEVCGISYNNELLVGYIRSTEHSHTGYEVSNDDTSMSGVDEWLKPTEAFVFTPEQLNPLQELVDEGYDAYNSAHHLQVQRMLKVIENFLNNIK